MNEEGTGGQTAGPHTLTEREIAVVLLVARGLSNAEIGRRLEISHRTVQAHVAAACKKTGTRSRTHLAVHALQTGVIPFDDADLGAPERPPE